MLQKLWKNVHQSFLVVALCVGIVVGMILALVLRANYFASPIWVTCAILALLIAYLKPKAAFVIVAVLSGMILAFFRIANELKSENYIREFWGKNVVVTGIIDGDPETDEGMTKIKLKNLKFGDEEKVNTSSIFVSLNENEELARNDELKLEGKISDGFGTYTGYMYRPKIIKWSRPEPGNWILKVRNWFAERIKTLIPDEKAMLGLSYLLGMKTGLPKELSEKLRTVGLVHIVVASGAHLAILVEVARKIFGKISRFAGVLFSILFVVLFMAMVGWTPSILRAGMMTILTILAWYSGRKIAPWRIILIVAAVTLIINPMFLINMGWLLSFASYAGITILGPKITKFFYGIKKPSFVGSVIITTLGATIMTLPIILYYYGQISLISAAANLLILPTLPWAMGLVFATGMVTGVSGIEMVVAWCAIKLLDFHIAVVSWFGEMKWFLVEIPTYQPWIFLLYLPVTVLLLGPKMIKLRKGKY